jgi:hypothetical protein
MKRVNKDERFWLLDGKPNNPFYPRNRYTVSTKEYFKKDFNYADDVDDSNLYINFKYKNRLFYEPHNFLPNFLVRNNNNDEEDAIKGIELTNKSVKRKKSKKIIVKKGENKSEPNNSSFDEDSEYEASVTNSVDSDDCKETITLDV